MKAPLLALALASTGCGVVVSGDFDGVPFAPDSSVLAVVDEHDFLLRDGAVVPITRPVQQQRIHVLLTAARVDVVEDWRGYDTDTLLETKRQLATEDTLLLKDIPLDRFAADEPIDGLVEDGEQKGDFTVLLGAAQPPEDQVATRGLGSKVRVRIDPKGFGPGERRGGSLAMAISIQREREAGQDGDVATGEVTLDFGASILPERLAEANLTVAEPVVACVHDKGPNAAGACRVVDELPYVDETGVVP